MSYSTESSSTRSHSKSDNKIKMRNTSIPEYKDALNIFFILKHKYESGRKKICPSCGELANGSSNAFRLENNTYNVKCPAGKCGLHIDIYNGDYASTEKTLTQYRKVFEDIKQQIIQLRMKYIFWYGTSLGTSTRGNEDFREKFRKLWNEFLIAKQQYNEVSVQYYHINFLDEERKAEIETITNSIQDKYTELRESFPELVLAWNNNTEANYETMYSIVKEQITANESKITRDNIMYSERGHITKYNERGEVIECRVVNMVGSPDKIAYNISGNEPVVRVFEMDAPVNETPESSSNDSLSDIE